MKKSKVKILIVLDLVILICAIALVIAVVAQNKENEKILIQTGTNVQNTESVEGDKQNKDKINQNEKEEVQISDANEDIENESEADLEGNESDNAQGNVNETDSEGKKEFESISEEKTDNRNETEEGSKTESEEESEKETGRDTKADLGEDQIVDLPVAEDYKQGIASLSTKKVGWCFERKKDNVPSGTYEPFDIEPFGAYYLNKDVKEGDKVIYFSFDCGYEYGYTAKIMDTLKKHGIKATFFVTKSFLDTDAELAKRMKEEGHIVGNHTLNHPSLPEKDAERVYEEVHGMEQLFKEKTGYEMDKFIRPPMGEYSESVLKELQNMGYTTIFWSIAYGDYDVNNQPGKDYVVDHFKKYHHNGAITLTHTVSSSNAEALDDVLTYLENQGYRFGSLAELRAKSVE